MRSSYQIARLGHTAIRIHLSMLLVVPYVWLQFRPDSLASFLYFLGLLLAIFFCILLHELGHTLAARRYGIQVSSIVLWPLGGIANLSRPAEKAGERLLISAAGPMVNLSLAALFGLAPWGWLTQQASRGLFWLDTGFVADVGLSLAFNLAIANLTMAVFNLLPLYPLDGGQIARAALHMLLGPRRADRLTLLIALPLAVALVGLGLYFQDVVLVLASLLLLLGASTLNPRLLYSLNLWITALADRGAYYRLREDYDRAVEQYGRAIRRWPNQPARYVQRAILYLNLDEIGLASADIQRALELDPNYALAITLRGELYSLNQQVEPAFDCFRRAIELKPDWYVPYVDRAGLWLDQGNPDQALADLNRAIRINPKAPIAYLTRSMARFRLGDIAGAQADADQVLAHSSGPNAQAGLVFPELFLVGIKGQLDWAEMYYGRALERLPASAQPYEGRADAYRINDRLAQAVADYAQAIQRDPSRARLYLNRGRVYRQMGELEAAAADLRVALRLADKAHLKRNAQTLLDEVNPPAMERFRSVSDSILPAGSRKNSRRR